MTMAVKMLRLYHKLLLLPIGIYLGMLAIPGTASNSSPSAAFSQREDVQIFIHELETQDHFDHAFLENVFANAKHRQSVIDAMDRPFKQPPPWYRYARPLLTPERFNQGLVFWNAHHQSLSRAEAEFGVPSEVIVAIIGVETFYGQVTGNYRLIDSLSTLAFDYPRRASFFKDELKQFLRMSRDEGLNPLQMKGSFAGAIGLAQFMPSNYRRYGIDFNHDGQIDLWNSPDDSIGSIAHYLKEHGWQRDSWDVRPVKQLSLPLLERETKEKGLSEWRSQEMWQKLIGGKPQWPENSRADDHFAIMKLEIGNDDPYYIWVGPNFQVITRYNRSRLYASAVWSLACQLAEARGHPSCAVTFPM